MGIELFDLTGKVALITGATQGIGLAIARGLAQAGARVVINARNAEKLERAVATLVGEGLAASGCRFDLINGAEVRERVAALEQEVGRIDILVNNAGIQRRSPLEQFDEKLWREVLDINLTGLFLVTQQVVRGMIARKSGQDHQHLFADVRGVASDRGGLHRGQGWSETAHQVHGGGVGEAQHPIERYRPRVRLD